MNLQAQDLTHTSHHRHDEFWLDDQFSKLPFALHRPIQFNYGRSFEQHGRQVANRYLLSVVELTAGKRFTLESGTHGTNRQGY